MTSQTGKQIITIHILSNMLRSKDNQTMNFFQLIKCNREIIYLKNRTQRRVEKRVPDPFI